MAKKITIEEINLVFTPAQEILDPNRFIGRYDEIKKGIISLSTPGSFVAIYGLRGLGKSSLGHQIKRIAEGDLVLAKRLGLKHYLPKKNFNFIVKLIQCDEFCPNIYSLLKRIFFGDDKNQPIFSHTKLEGKTLEKVKEKVSTSIGIAIKAWIAKGNVKADAAQESTYSIRESDDLVQMFKQMLGTIQNDNHDNTGILILLDEFDIVKDKSGFASIIKTCSSDYVKFGIIGIGEDITELLEDHASVGRQIDKIEVNVMPTIDLMKIIDNVEEKLDGLMKFEPAIKVRMSDDAEGFAYYIHLLGKEALLRAFELNLKIVDKTIYDKIYNDFLEGRLGFLYETIYQKAVRTSPESETLLKLFAEDKEHHILTETIYHTARQLGISDPHKYMQSLTNPSLNKKPILTKAANRHYRFSDPIFKVYAKKRVLFHKK